MSKPALRRVEEVIDGKKKVRLVPMTIEPLEVKPKTPPQIKKQIQAVELPILSPCRWEGKVITPCPLGDINRDVRDCTHDKAKWDGCRRSPGQAKPGVISCVGCELRDIPRRHLIYHLYPGINWRQRAAAIVNRWSLFTGRCHIAVAIDKNTPTIEEIRKFFPDEADVFPVNNVPDDKGREYTSWNILWEKLNKHAAEGDYVWRMHSKATSPWRNGQSALVLWTQVAEDLMLNHPSLILKELVSKPIVGPFATPFAWPKAGRNDFGWHYSGSYYVVKVGEAFSRGIATDENTWGVEVWPGLRFQKHEAGEIWKVPGGQPLHDMNIWKTLIPQYQQWLKENPPEIVGIL